jgi:hypothetical protein
MLVAVLALSCAAIAWSVQNPYISAFSLVVVAVVAWYALHRAFDFADKNPAAAILEGAEFVKHEQIQQAAKGIPQFPPSDTILTSEPEQIPLITDASTVNQPDESPSPSPDENSSSNENEEKSS